MGLSKGYPQAWLHQLHPMLASHRAGAWVQAAPARPAPGPAAASTADAGPAAAPRGRRRGSDQVWSCLLGLGRDPHRGQLPDVQQPGQPFGVAPVGLDPIPGRAFQLDGATTTQPTPAAWSARASPNPVGPAS
jgi:hypothetical protein